MQNYEIPKIKIIVLAAGKGTRMNSEIPKVLMSLQGQPMIKYLLKSVKESGLDESPVIVIGYKGELVRKELGEKYLYVEQTEQRGTGHAVACAKDFLKDKAENILVLYGDIPFLHPDTIQDIFEHHIQSGNNLTMATVKLKDFGDWRACFEAYSRVIRDKAGNMIRTVEKKDAEPDELKITEINPCFLCMKADWLWEKINQIKDHNAQHEFYLPDLITIATSEGNEIETISIDAHEALGANTLSELETLARLARGEILFDQEIKRSKKIA